MTKKCKYCKEKRDIEYEFTRPNSCTCVFCNDKGIDDSNYKNKELGMKEEPLTLPPIRPVPLTKMRFHKDDR